MLFLFLLFLLFLIRGDILNNQYVTESKSDLIMVKSDLIMVKSDLIMVVSTFLYKSACKMRRRFLWSF